MTGIRCRINLNGFNFIITDFSFDEIKMVGNIMKKVTTLMTAMTTLKTIKVATTTIITVTILRASFFCGLNHF